MQATDAQLHDDLPQDQAYDQALGDSAVAGMAQVLGDQPVPVALDAARDVQLQSGFDVRQRC